MTPGDIVVYSSRRWADGEDDAGERIGRLVDLGDGSPVLGNWPTVELLSGERVCLNPALTEMRPGTPDEAAYFRSGGKIANCGQHSFRADCEACAEAADRAGFTRPGALRSRLLQVAQGRVNEALYALAASYATGGPKERPLHVLVDPEDPSSLIVDLPSGGRLRGRATVRFRWEADR